MNLKQQREAALKAARDLAETAKSEGRNLTTDEQGIVEQKLGEADDLKGQIEEAEKSADLMAKIGNLGGGQPDKGDDEPAKSLGEHFIKSVGRESLERVKTVTGATVAAPEWSPQAKAAGDAHAIPASAAPWATTYDRTVVRGLRRPVVSDLFGTGTLSGNAVSYMVESALEGSITTVAEDGQKPQVHFQDPTVRTDALKKIAAILGFTDEMAEDFDFLVSEINNRGLYELALVEEAQLLTGAGTGSQIEGLLNRSGVQTESAADNTDNADALFRAMTKIQTATGLSPDAVVINPSDYQALRLSTDGNGQYFGGGFFAGQYGQGGVPEQPPLWGLRTVVSPAVSANTAIVGAFGAAATVYRKGGVRVESTNSHGEDFDYNRIRTRIEERVALAVRVPAAFVDVTLSTTDPA